MQVEVRLVASSEINNLRYWLIESSVRFYWTESRVWNKDRFPAKHWGEAFIYVACNNSVSAGRLEMALFLNHSFKYHNN